MHKRREFEGELALTHNGVNVIVKAREISRGGMLIEMPSSYVVGDVLQIAFMLGGAMIEERAEIRYGRPADNTDFVGVQFVAPSSDHQALIEDYVQS